jgi:hypothetical protein
LPSTPIAPGVIATLADAHLTFLSEYVIGIEMNGSGWRSNISRIKSYLEKMQASLPKYVPVQDD